MEGACCNTQCHRPKAAFITVVVRCQRHCIDSSSGGRRCKDIATINEIPMVIDLICIEEYVSGCKFHCFIICRCLHVMGTRYFSVLVLFCSCLPLYLFLFSHSLLSLNIIYYNFYSFFYDVCVFWTNKHERNHPQYSILKCRPNSPIPNSYRL